MLDGLSAMEAANKVMRVFTWVVREYRDLNDVDLTAADLAKVVTMNDKRKEALLNRHSQATLSAALNYFKLLNDVTLPEAAKALECMGPILTTQLYIIRVSEDNIISFKIGYSCDPKHRLAQLNNVAPVGIKYQSVDFQWACPYKDIRAIEKAAHARAIAKSGQGPIIKDEVFRVTSQQAVDACVGALREHGYEF